MAKISTLGILLSKVPLPVMITLSLTVCFTSCEKKLTVPVVTTAGVTAITQTSASSGGNVTNDGGAEITSRGVCWSTSENPTTSNSKTIDGTGTGAYTSNLTQLNPGTKYYLRAYSENEVGTGYGDQQSFTTAEVVLPSVTTANVSLITVTTAVSGGNVTSDGGGPIIVRGVCWSSTSQNPTVDDDRTLDGSGAGIFTSNLTGLSPGTDYHVRAYATNSAGTGYGSTISFPTAQSSGTGIIFNPDLTYGTVTDIDGNTYKTIVIGSKKGTSGLDGTNGINAAQVWMAENLRTTKYSDGTDIPLVTDNGEWTSLSTPGFCWPNNDAATYKNIYGALYNWYSIDTKKLCPAGWHVPNDDEFRILTGPTGWTSTTGGALKETGTVHWSPLNTGATNETGFTALPGGYRHESIGSFGQLQLKGYYWTSTQAEAQTGSVSAWAYEITGGAIYVLHYNFQKKYGLSVRCLKD